jgi:S-formylglutathione hydrolase FrmB
MLPWSHQFSGRLEQREIDSPELLGNHLGDPHMRPIWVYLPPEYDQQPAQRFPTVYVIQGYTGHVVSWANRGPFRQPYIETADILFAREDVPSCVMVYVDAWTAYGGSQYVNSPGTGNYHSYLCDDIVSWVDANYRTIPDRRSRAITGKSSGGFGAMITPMLRPDLFAALATHAGDTLYEACYLPEFAQAVRVLRNYDHDINVWWQDFNSRVAWTKPGDEALITALGCSAAFSADADGTPLLPFDQVTGRVIDDRWQRWLDWDPVRMVSKHRDAVLSLDWVWIDAGKSDEYYLDLGAAAFRAELEKVGLPDEKIYFELIDARHGGIDYRYPMALEWLANRLVRE